MVGGGFSSDFAAMTVAEELRFCPYRAAATGWERRRVV